MNNSTTSFYMATKNDVDDIMLYIETEWKSGHILAKDKNFFLYQYAEGDAINFVLSRDDSGNINGMLGFIKSSSLSNADVWTTMWKVSKHVENPVLGIQLLMYLREQGYKTLMSSGINTKTIGIYHYLGYKTGTLQQWFLPNQNIEHNTIAIISSHIKQKKKQFLSDEGCTLKLLLSASELENFSFDMYKSRVPYKDQNYFKCRYFDHPIYQYQVYGAYRQSNLVMLVVTRIVATQNSVVLRIVDVHGDEQIFPYVAQDLQNIMVDNACEYTDILCYGMSENLLESACFNKLDLESDTIIPNYFQPFLQKNVPIHFFTDAAHLNEFRIFKADGDQDRPS